MAKKQIMFPSVTYAIRAKSVLRSNGIYADMVKTSKSPSQKGCGYSLTVRKDFDKAVSILRKNGIDFQGY